MKVPEALLPHLSCPTEDHQGWCSAHSCRRFPHRGQSKDTCSVFVQNSNTWVSAQFTSLCISVSNSLFRNHTWAGHAFDWFYWPCSRGQGGALGDPEPPWKPLCHAVLIMVPHDTLAQFTCQIRSFARIAFVLDASRMPGFHSVVWKGQDGIVDHWIHGPFTISSSELEMDSICFPQFLFNESALTHELIGVCLGWL